MCHKTKPTRKRWIFLYHLLKSTDSPNLFSHPFDTRMQTNPTDWGCRIHRLHLCRGVTPTGKECPGYDIKQSDGEALVLKLWGMWRTPSVPLLSGPLWPGVVAPDRVIPMGQTELWCPWCNGYRRRKWTRRHEFKYWTRLIALHIARILLKGMNPIILSPVTGK